MSEASGSGTTRVTINLPTALHKIVEREKVEQYVRGWREQPQTEGEFGWSDRAVSEAMAEEPWEPDAETSN